MSKCLVAAVCAAVLLLACAESSAPLEASQPGAPCGNVGVVCYDNNASGQLVATGMCCWSGSVCGGGFPNVGCPAGQCCEEGDVGLAPPTTPRPPPRPQWSAR